MSIFHERKHPEILNRFLFNVKEAFTPKPKQVSIPRPCKGTTNIVRWANWIAEAEGNIEWNIITSKNGQSLYIVYRKST